MQEPVPFIMAGIVQALFPEMKFNPFVVVGGVGKYFLPIGSKISTVGADQRIQQRLTVEIRQPVDKRKLGLVKADAT